jgi:hypothetical protein
MKATTLLIFTLLGGVMADPATIDLAGTWDIAPMKDTSYTAAVVPTQPTAWRQTKLPDIRWCDDEASNNACLAGPGVWLRRRIELDKSQAGLDAVVHWEILRWGFEAFVNGTSIGVVETYGPGTLSIKRGLLKPGSNELLFKVRNWASLPRGGTLFWPLIPAGAAVFDFGSKASILFGDIELQMFDTIRIRSVMMRPSPADSSVAAAVRLESTSPVNDSLKLSIILTDAKGVEIGSVKKTVNASKVSSTPILLNVKLKRFDLWSPETPVLTKAHVALSRSG